MPGPCEVKDDADRLDRILKILKCAAKNTCGQSAVCSDRHLDDLQQEIKQTDLVEKE